LTATADRQTREDIRRRLELDSAELFLASFDRPNIRYAILAKSEPRRQILSFLRAHEGESGIVYCLSRATVDKTAAGLVANGIKALPYHAGLDSGVLKRTQERFLGEEGLVLVATIAFGMGIDKPDVRFVAHFDLPGSLEAFYQETGRAGRDGLPAETLLLYGMQDLVMRRNMIAQASPRITLNASSEQNWTHCWASVKPLHAGDKPCWAILARGWRSPAATVITASILLSHGTAGLPRRRRSRPRSERKSGLVPAI
jgi:RecQ family ATP-dependent DNA helicase